ncbi:MAG TPA: hypothetical protein VGL76_02520 [Gaiellaceae bacterium]
MRPRTLGKIVTGLAAAMLVVLGGTGAATARGSGVEFTLRPSPSAGGLITAVELDRSAAIMRNRLARLGDHGTVARRSTLIVIRLDATVSAARKQIALITQRGAIEFYDREPSLLPPSIGAGREPVASTNLSALRRAKSAASGRALIVSCDAATAVVCPGANGGVLPTRGKTYYYLLKNDPALDGNDLIPSATRAGHDPATGVAIVSIQFTQDGERAFHAVTRAEAVRGQTLGTPQHVAIVVDDHLRSFPAIDYTTNPDGINPTTGAEITGLSSTGAAKHLAAVLRTGELPLHFVTVSERPLR